MFVSKLMQTQRVAPIGYMIKNVHLIRQNPSFKSGSDTFEHKNGISVKTHKDDEGNNIIETMDNGKVVTEVKISPRGELIYSATYEYKANGNVHKAISYATGNTRTIIKDSNGTVINQFRSDTDNYWASTTYEDVTYDPLQGTNVMAWPKPEFKYTPPDPVDE